MKEGQIGIGLIGAGDVLRSRHLPALATLPGARLAGVFDVNEPVAKALAADWPIDRVHTSLDAMLEDSAVDAVLIATPNSVHREYAESAARAGKHVMCEKPLAINMRDARAIVEACAHAGVKLQVGFQHRFQPQLAIARELLASGILGRAQSFQCTCSEPMDRIPGPDNYRYDGARSGGLTLIDFGTHRLDMLVSLIGPMAAVSAAMGNVSGQSDLEDNAVLLLEACNGALGSLAVHRFSRGAMTGNILHCEAGLLCYGTDLVNPYQAAPLAVYVETPFEHWPDELRRHYYGSVYWERPDRGWVTITPPKVNTYRAEWEAFLDAVRNDTAPPVTGEEALHILEIVLASYEAFHTGRRVALPLPPDFTVEPPRFVNVGMQKGTA